MDEKELIAAGTKIVSDVIKDQTKEIYSDALKPAMQETGGALQAIVGLFNNVVLYPVKKANIKFQYKLEAFEKDLTDKIKEIPPEKLIEPPLLIAGPTLEALKYTFDTKELRELYLELLASSMNSDREKFVHSSFVEVIKSMSPLDAIILNEFGPKSQVPVARMNIGFDDQVFSQAMPQIFAPSLISERDPFEVSRSLQNLCRLGLLTHRDNTITGFNYETFKSDSFAIMRMEQYKRIKPDKELEFRINGEVILINDFGKSFSNACSPNKK